MNEPKNIPLNRRATATVVTDTTKLLWSQDSPWVRIRNQLEQLRVNLQVLISPGDKQFKDVPKRVRLMLISGLIPLLFVCAKLWLLPQNQSLYLWAIVAVGLAAVTYVGMIWGVKGQVRRDSYWSVLPMPAMFVLANVMFLSFLFVGELNRVYLWGLFGLAIGIFMTLLYILSLAVNILNVSLFYTIPLSRLGETVAYLFGVITVFLGSYVIAEVALSPLIAHAWIELGLIASFVFVTTMALVNSLWTYFVMPTKAGLYIVVAISLLLTVSLGILVMCVPYVWMVGTLQSFLVYIIFGFIIHKEQNTLNIKVQIEYLIAVIAALLMVAFL